MTPAKMTSVLSSTSFVAMETDMVVSLFLWLLIRPSLQAAIGNDVTNAVCPYNCHHHGDCHVRSSKSVVACDCHMGWGGDTCDVPCERHCEHGTCVFAGSKQLCLCSLGFKGETCTERGYDMAALLNLAKVITSNTEDLMPLVQDPRPEVQENIRRGSSTCIGNFVCRNGGRCVNGQMGGYRCQCNSSKYTGNFCQYTCPKPCLNGGTCVRLRRSGNEMDASDMISLPENQAVYRCACLEGFSGERCGKRLQLTTSVNNSTGT